MGKTKIRDDTVYKIKVNVAQNILSWQWLTAEHADIQSYVPPTKEQAMEEYEMSPIFNRLVDSIAYGMIKIIEGSG